MKYTHKLVFSNFSLHTPEGVGKLENITLDLNVEYSVEELLAVLANQGAFITALPALIKACIEAYKEAMAGPTPKDQPIAPVEPSSKVPVTPVEPPKGTSAPVEDEWAEHRPPPLTWAARPKKKPTKSFRAK